MLFARYAPSSGSGAVCRFCLAVGTDTVERREVTRQVKVSRRFRRFSQKHVNATGVCDICGKLIRQKYSKFSYHRRHIHLFDGVSAARYFPIKSLW